MTTNTMSSRLWATGLAALTCVGVAGAVAVRVSPASAEVVPAPEPQAAQQVATYTPEQLAAYKQQLDEQAAKLQQYEARLTKLANQLSTDVAKGKKPAIADVAAVEPAPAPPIITPAPAPAPAPNP